MIVVTEYQWKQLVEGGYRHGQEHFTQLNYTEGNDCIREYWYLGAICGRMRVYDAANTIDFNQCTRLYESEQQWLDATSHIYVPTPEELDEWEEQGLNIADEIAAREVV